jgi:hypothetical protein
MFMQIDNARLLITQVAIPVVLRGLQVGIFIFRLHQHCTIDVTLLFHNVPVIQT